MQTASTQRLRTTAKRFNSTSLTGLSDLVRIYFLVIVSCQYKIESIAIRLHTSLMTRHSSDKCLECRHEKQIEDNPPTASDSSSQFASPEAVTDFEWPHRNDAAVNVCVPSKDIQLPRRRLCRQPARRDSEPQPRGLTAQAAMDSQI